MCGIFTIHNSANISESTVRTALRALQHRGPDGDGVWISPQKNVALGHIRLAIVGVDNGVQPIGNEDGSIQLIANGEFYDYQRIRTDLEKQGHKFSTRSDSEIALHLYEEYGTDCLKYLRGEFAFVIWDQTKKELFVARDRFGIKPICYAIKNGALYIASEAKALFAAGVEAAWDGESFFQSANTQYVLPDRTLFAGVKQLQPGHYLLARGVDIQIRQYWDIDYDKEVDHLSGQQDKSEIISPFGEALLIEEFSALFHQAVRLRLRADVPICAHLSGGLDSSAVVGVAMQYASSPIKCFSISFEESSYDEQVLAREMAGLAGADFESISVSQEQLLQNLPAAVFQSEGFAVNGHLPAKYMLNKRINQAGYKVALTGEGADELVAGYPHLRSDLFKSDGRTELLAGLHSRNTASRGIMLQHGQSLSLAAVQEKLDYVPAFLEAKGTLGHKICAVLSNSYKNDFSTTDCYSQLLDSFDIKTKLTGRNRVNQSLYLWSKTALANYILRTIGDGTEMAHSVEGRLPFLDHHLFEYASRLPIAMKIKGTVEKFVLRQAVQPLITKNIYQREKHPFVAPPISRFADNGASDILNDTLRSKAFEDVPFFDSKKIIDLLDRLPSLSPEDQSAVDPVLMTAMSALALQQGFRL